MGEPRRFCEAQCAAAVLSGRALAGPVPGAGPIRGASGVGQVITDMLERVAGGGSVTVSCALQSRDGPRLVELASNNDSGPPITAGLLDTDATRIPVTSTARPPRESPACGNAPLF